MFRCRGRTLPWSSTVMRLSWRCPLTLDPAKVPGPSKRSRFIASVFVT
ncbi:hypothetical protein WME99_50630 [Sorangium sp. So ce136]